jgi:hypothetical protein
MMAHPLSTPLDAAEMFTARGWVVFPCDHPMAGLHCTGSARACRERRCRAARDPGQRGKCPRVPRWGQIIEPVGAAQREAWWGRGTIPTNIAIACGPSGLIIVDEDEPGAFAAFCASIGVEVPETFIVETGRGRHYYFTVPVDPQTGERVPVGNSPGALAGWHCDVRGGASGSGERGGYAITAGSEHASRKIYTAPEPYAEAIEAPRWLVEAILSPGPPTPAEGLADGAGSVGESGLRTSDGARWDDETRYGTAQDLLGQFERHCDEVTEPGGAFRHALFRAARDGWRLVHLGLLTEDAMQRALEACVWRVWQAEPNDDDLKIFWEEALPAAQRSPWELTGAELRSRATVPDTAGRTFLRPSEAAALAAAERAVTSEDDGSTRTTDGNLPVAPARDVKRRADRERKRKARKDRRRAALRQLDARKWAEAEWGARHAEPIMYLDGVELLAEEPPGYLVPDMIYRDSLAVLFGGPGSGKSFLALDIALSLVTGQPWRQGYETVKLTGRDGGPGKVHYVMAEGKRSNQKRTPVWLYRRGVSAEDWEACRGRFTAVPTVLQLTEPGIRQYLKRVRRDKPDLIILDTRNPMFVGKESSGEDYGAMIRVLHMIREAAGGAAVLLLDHTGVHDQTRVRGSNAQLGGIDTEIKMEDRDGLRVVTMTRDKDEGVTGDDAAKWLFRFEPVDDMPGVPWGRRAPVLIMPCDESAIHQPIAIEPTWANDETPVPGPVFDLRGRGRKYAIYAFRILRWVGRRDGLAVADLADAIKGAIGAGEYDRTQLNRGLALLEAHGIVEHPAGASGPLSGRWALTAEYDGPALGGTLG